MAERKSNANNKEITTLLDAAIAADLSPEVYTEQLISEGFNPYKFKIKTPEVVADPENKRFGSQINVAKYFEQNPGGTATPLGSVMHDKSDEDNWQFLVAIIMF